MARLPTPGSDAGSWGTVLNEFLSVNHNADGTLKNQVTNVKDFGAIGDGQSHPLSSIYSTLIQAQTVHPTAATLSDELDGVATQTAINYLRDNGGGTLYCPRGVYVCNTEILLPKSVIYDNTISQQVNWVGDGMFSTKYKWNTDLGNGKWAVRPADGTLGGTGYKCNGLIRDILFYGPNETYTLGVAPCQMHGVMGGAERKLERVGIRYFYAGLCIVGDHTQFINVECHKNYYGIYFENPYSNLFGGMLFEGCQINGCPFAAIGLDYRATGQGTFIKCYIGGGPYGIYKECNGATSYSATITGFCNSTFQQCTMEYIGNGLISDESEANGGDPIAYWYSTQIDMVNFNWEPNNNLAAKAKTSVVGMGKAERLTFRGFKETFGWDPGSLGSFNLVRAPGVFLEGDIQALVTRAKNGGKHLFAAHSDQSVNRIQFHHIGPTWDGWGHGRKCTTGQSWVAGDILMDSTNTVSLATPANLCYVNAFSGIALEDNDGTANNICLVVEQGLNVTVNADVITLLTTGYGDFVKMSATSGKVGAAVNGADGVLLGYAHATANGSGGANGTYSIRIINPPLMSSRPMTLPIRTESGTSVNVSNLALREGYVRFTSASAVTYTIPANATTPLPIGISIRLFAAGAGGVTVSPASGVTLNGTATVAQNNGKTLTQVATDVWDII